MPSGAEYTICFPSGVYALMLKYKPVDAGSGVSRVTRCPVSASTHDFGGSCAGTVAGSVCPYTTAHRNIDAATTILVFITKAPLK